ncbi:MAG: hypothetical protein E7578_00370 [Ruminococcaceae bacterium]|nr:hypothetical protein [Oscillospiraceae bacterium]
MIAKSKNTNFNRLLSGFLSLLMVMSVLPLGIFSVVADTAAEYTFAIVDASDAAVAGATVTLYDDNREVAKGETDGTGKAVIKADAGDNVTYKVEKDGYSSAMGVTTAGAVVTVKLIRRPTTTVVGYVKDSTGAAITGAQVKIADKGIAITDTVGKFLIGGVYTDASYVINVTCDGYKDVAVTANLKSENMITMFTKDDGDFAFAADKVTVKYGDSVSNTLINSAPSANVTYESSDESIATVDNNGNVTIKNVTGADGVVITARRAESLNYLYAEDSYTLVVVKGDQATLQWTKSVPEDYALNFKSGAYTNTVIGGSGDGDVTYKSSDTNVATVNNDGVVTLNMPGTVTIMATKSGGELYNDKSATYSLVIDKVEQAPLEFAIASPDSIEYGQQFANAASGGTVLSDIIYSTDDATVAEIDTESNVVGAIKTNSIGAVVVTATMPGNEYYKDVSASYTLYIVATKQKGFQFQKGTEGLEVACGETFTNAAFGNGETNVPVVYKSEDDTIATVDENGVVTAHKTGIVTISATAPAGGNYSETTISYELNIYKGYQELTFENGNIDIPAIFYGETYQNKAIAKTGVTYKTSNKNIATIDENGVVTPLKSGVIIITATAEDTADYYGATATYRLTINKAEPKIEFENGADVTVQFNDNDNVYQNEAFCQSMIDDGTVTDIAYSVSNTDIVADLDPATGKFTITGTGTATISVTFAENERYAAKTASYTITVIPDDQKIVFPEDKYTLLSGTNFATVPVATEDGDLFGTGAITYAVKSDDSGVIKSFDVNTGAIEFTNKVGTVVIVATKAEDRNYNAATAEYTLTVEYWKPEREFFAPVGEKNYEANEWYIGNVTIQAEDGYSLSFDNHVDNAEWLPALDDVVVDDSKETTVSFYLRDNNTGAITAQYTKLFKKDCVAPSAEINAKEKNTWEKFLSIFTGLFWDADEDVFTVTSSDATSGVAKIEYYIDYDKTTTATYDELAALADSEWIAYTDEGIAADESTVFAVYARVTDHAGNCVYVSTNGIIHDPAAPEVELTVTGDTANGVYYKDVTIDFDVTDAEPSSGITKVTYNVVVTDLDGVSTVIVDNEEYFADNSEDPEYADLVRNVSKSGTDILYYKALDYNNYTMNVTVTATDRAGNVTVESTEFFIRADRPELEEVIIEEGYGKRTIQFAIKDFHDLELFAETVEFTVVATDIEGNVLENNDGSLYTIEPWIYEGEGRHTTTAYFTGDAIYNLHLEYSYDYDEEKGQEPFDTEFTVDTTSPTGNLSIDKTDKLWTDIFETLTFGLWTNDSFEVVGSAYDSITGVNSVEFYEIDGTLVDSKLGTTKEEIVAALDLVEWTAIDSVEDFTEFAVKTIVPDSRTTVFVKITDVAGNYRYISTDGIIVEDDEAVIEFTSDDPEADGYYTSDFNVNISVTDPEIYSGIAKIEYWVVKDNDTENPTQEGVLYTFGDVNPAYDKLTNTFTDNVVIETDKNNSDNVCLYVEVTDNAGNKTVRNSEQFKIDNTAPVVNIEFTGENKNNGALDGNFTSREVKITVTERTSGFDADAVLAVLGITAVDAKGNAVENAYTIGEWTTVPGENINDDTHTVVITFAKDARYTFEIASFTDKAGNKAEFVIGEAVSETYGPDEFVVDTTAPIATVTVNGNDIVGNLTFDKETVSVTVTPDDATSGVQYVQWLKVNSTIPMEQAELEAAEWSNEAITEIAPNEIATIYAKIVDNAGNYCYVGTNGLVIENNAAELTVTPAEPNANGYYSNDVAVNVTVTDPDIYSGIAKIEYWVICDGIETQKDTLDLDIVDDPVYDDLKNVFEGSIDVIAEKNNSDNVVLYVRATDNAGNIIEKSVELKIDVTAPVVDVKYINETKNDGAVDGNFTSRGAKITVTERTSGFDADAVLAALGITAFDAKGNAVENAYTIGEWTTTKGATPDEDTHTVVITFVKDARYTFEIASFNDLAGNASVAYEADSFVVDTTVPTGYITVGDKSDWALILEKLTFGLFGNSKVYVSATTDDATSGVQFIQWLKTDAKTVMTKAELDAAKWSDIDQKQPCAIPDEYKTIDPDEIATIYIKVVDNAGNYEYFNTQGIIIEDNAAEITITPAEPNKNGYYNSDVSVNIAVTDPDIYSGIKEVEYWVVCDGKETKRENLYAFDIENPVHRDIANTFDRDITVIANDNNSDNVKVFVRVTDNAGNEFIKESDVLKIDVTAPVVNVEYINENKNGAAIDGNFTSRDIKITVTERSSGFDADAVLDALGIDAFDAKGNAVENAYTIGRWVPASDTTPDEDTHTVTITCDKNAKFTFELASFTDLAGNEAQFMIGETAYETYGPDSFAVDTTAPTGSITITVKDKDGNDITEEWKKEITSATAADPTIFNRYYNATITVSNTSDDVTSGVQYVQWLKTDAKTVMTKAELDAAEWSDDAITSIAPDEIATIYIKIVDNAGNYCYIGTNGLIIEDNAAEITITPAEPNENGYYNSDVAVNIAVTDPDDTYSGIKEVEYWVVCDDKETKREKLYAFDIENPVHGDLANTFNQNITVIANDNNSDNVKVFVKVTDNAGNEFIKESDVLKIDVTAPVIEVEFEVEEQLDNAVKNYFYKRIATITITERSSAFDKGAANTAIMSGIKGFDVNGYGVDLKFGENGNMHLVGWTDVKGATPDEDTHTATVEFLADANYTFGFTYTDLAGNTSEAYNAEAFTVDTTAPTGSVTVGDLGVWEALLEKLTFGLYSNGTVTVTGTSADVTSPVQYVDYFKTDSEAALTVDELANVSWTAFGNGFDVAANEQFTVYLRIIDAAGNVAYISSNGIIVDDTAPVVESIKPEVTIKPEKPINGFYKSDFTVAVKVSESNVKDVYSGLKTITYVIHDKVSDEKETGILYQFDTVAPGKDQLKTVWEDEKAITVNAKKFNSNDVEISVTAEDNAGNFNTKVEKVKIDTTIPTISVDYGNDTGIGEYYKTNRTATIVITERNFDPSDVIVTITNTDNVVPTISAFTTINGNGNGDNTKHTATIKYTADGDYTFDIKYTDEAGNAAKGVTSNDAENPFKFTIDKTVPVIDWAFDNNKSTNTSYFNDDRILTVTVTEHNFDPAKFIASTNGRLIDGKWDADGDRHIGRFEFIVDDKNMGKFNFSCVVTDMAGNSYTRNDVPNFVIDKTQPDLTLTDNVNPDVTIDTPTAYNDKISFTITYTDIYLVDSESGYEIKVTDSTGKDVTDDFRKDEDRSSAIEHSSIAAEEKVDTVTITYTDDSTTRKLPDGIYTIKATVYDMAGNTDTVTKTFSVNRDSSNYLVDSYLDGLIKNAFNKVINDKIVIREINCTELKNISIKVTRDNQTITLEKDKDYVIEVVKTDGDWYEYSYIINPDKFAEDGNYKILVESEDGAGNKISNISATGDYRKTIEFFVDDTAPTIIVSGLDDSPYDAEQITAFITYEDNIAVDRVEVTVTGGRDESVTYVIGEGDLSDLNKLSDQIEHIIKAADDRQTLTFVVYDEAGNASESITKTVTVSTNLWVLFINNTPVLIASIVALVLILGAAVTIPVMRKRRAK